MSAVGKAFKKLRNFAHKLTSKLDPVFRWVHKKTAKIRNKIESSPIFKVVAAAVLIYFGGAALIGAMSAGGTAAGGIASAWGGVQGAGSALAAGNFSAAGSAIAGGWTGAAGAAATSAATTAATSQVGAGVWGGQAAASTTGKTLLSTMVPAGSTASTTGMTMAQLGTAATGAANGTVPTALINATGVGAGTAGVTGSAVGGAGAVGGIGGASELASVADLAATTPAVAPTTGGLLGGMSAGEGMMWSAGINAGTQLIGGAMQGRAAEKEAEEARKRMTYWGVDGAGNKTDLNIGGLLGKVNLSPMTNISQAGQYQPWQPSTLDDLTKTVG